MREENGIIIFENAKEEENTLKNGYKGLYIIKSPFVYCSCDVLKITKSKRKIRIGIIPIDYIKDTINLKKEINKVWENSKFSKQEIPKRIAISSRLNNYFNN